LPDVEADLWKEVAAVPDFVDFAAVDLVVVFGLVLDGPELLLGEDRLVVVPDSEQ
jgi:hypothetical protein